MDSWRQRTTKVSCRQLSGAFDPRTLKLLHKIAAWPRQHGDYASAEASQRKAYGGMLLALGPAHPVTVRMQINLAEVELHLGRLDEARQLLQTALAQPRLSDSRYDLPRIQSLLASCPGNRPVGACAALVRQGKAPPTRPPIQREIAARLAVLYLKLTGHAADAAIWKARARPPSRKQQASLQTSSTH